MRKKTVSLLRHKPQINRASAEQGAVFPSTGVAAKQDTYRGFQTGLSSRGKVLVCSVGLQLPLPNVCYFWSKTNLDIVCVIMTNRCQFRYFNWCFCSYFFLVLALYILSDINVIQLLWNEFWSWKLFSVHQDPWCPGSLSQEDCQNWPVHQPSLHFPLFDVRFWFICFVLMDVDVLSVLWLL